MFEPAKREAVHLRMALQGPSGSGKTMTALRIATALHPRSKIAVIDTERGSSKLYAGVLNPDGGVLAFDVAVLKSFGLRDYISAFHGAGNAGYPVVVVDSWSHAWMGEGGILAQVDASSSRGMQKWAKVKPIERQLWDTLLHYPGDVIVTMRTKTDYVEGVDHNGKKTMEKVGLAPMQRADSEYEFDIVGEIGMDHALRVAKTRCVALADRVFPLAGAALAAEIRAWLNPPPTAPAAEIEQRIEQRHQEAAARDESRDPDAPTFDDLLHEWWHGVVKVALADADLLGEHQGVGTWLEVTGDGGPEQLSAASIEAIAGDKFGAARANPAPWLAKISTDEGAAAAARAVTARIDDIMRLLIPGGGE